MILDLILLKFDYCFMSVLGWKTTGELGSLVLMLCFYSSL